ACAGLNGATSAEIATDLDALLTTINPRLTRLCKQGRLVLVQRFSGGSPRYYADPVFAQAAQILNQSLARGVQGGTISAKAPVCTQSPAKVTLVTRTGTTERHDRMAGLCPPDTFRPPRAGSLDFKTVPSLRPFRTGAVR
ncbi:hypothetical protein, partial [Sphaerotilus sp.]|uniref:hypothetical protein n=1 Tax=Sphaerotilus sp. TaxID=2093942 RepID=UPI00286EAD10